MRDANLHQRSSAPLILDTFCCAGGAGKGFAVAYRHRQFECSFSLMVPPCACHKAAGTVLGMYGGGTRQDTRKGKNPGGGNTQKANASQSRRLMINQAVPPIYTEHIGGYLMAALEPSERAA